VILPCLISRVRDAWRSGWADPVTHYGAVYHGLYQAEERQIRGFVAHARRVSERPPDSIVVFCDSDVTGATESFEHRNLYRDWRFTVDVGVSISTRDILGSRLKVFAVDRLGGPSELSPDGKAELALIKQTFGRPPETELVVHFAQGGNSGAYVREGWYGRAQEHTWTEGTGPVPWSPR